MQMISDQTNCLLTVTVIVTTVVYMNILWLLLLCNHPHHTFHKQYSMMSTIYSIWEWQL